MGRPGHNCHMIAPQGSTLSAQQDSQDGEGSECPSTRGIIWINRLEKTNPGKGTSSGRAPHVNKTIFNEPPEAVARTKTTMYPPPYGKSPLLVEWSAGQRWAPVPGAVQAEARLPLGFEESWSTSGKLARDDLQVPFQLSKPKGQRQRGMEAQQWKSAKP